MRVPSGCMEAESPPAALHGPVSDLVEHSPRDPVIQKLASTAERTHAPFYGLDRKKRTTGREGESGDLRTHAKAAKSGVL